MRSDAMVCASLTFLMIIFAASSTHADEWPTLGRDATRNAVSPEKGAPTDWNAGELDRETGKWKGSRNILWAAKLGSQTMGDPVVANGQIWIGTNNFIDDDTKRPDASVLMGFSVRDGKPLYKYISPRLKGGRVNDWPHAAIANSPLIEKDRMWFVTNRAEVVCLDTGPLARGEGDPRIVWKVDMMKDFGVSPCGSRMIWCHTSSVAAHKDRIYVITGNGVDEWWLKLPAPDAPSLICFNKNTGEVIWQDNSPGENILTGQWASPLVIEINGKAQVIAPQGDGWLRSFDALTGALIWKFDVNPKTSQFRTAGGTRNTLMAAPVFYDGRVYVASGHNAEFSEGIGRLVCIDPSKTGDISSELALDAENKPLAHRRVLAVDVTNGEKAVPNPNSGLIWEHSRSDRNGDGKTQFEETMHRTVASVAIKDDLLIAVDFSGQAHCLDAKTGKVHWTHDMLASVHAPPLIVDDKLYIGDEDGDLAIFRLTAAPPQNPLFESKLESGISTAPIFSDGVLYVASAHWLYAISRGAQNESDSSAKVGHWPQWRGPLRDNRSRDTGLLQEWPADGPPLVWRVDGIGTGIASVSITEGTVYTLGYHDGSEYVVALDEKTAQRRWQRRIGPETNMSSQMRWLSQRTPTVDGQRLYAVTVDGDCVCLSTATGDELWRVSYPIEFAAKKPMFGFCDRPLVDDNVLVCVPGGDKASVAAIDKATGKVNWQTLIPDAGQAAYGTTMTVESGGVRQYVVLLDRGLFGVRAWDGKLLWRYSGNSTPRMNSFTPLLVGDLIYHGNGFRGAGFAALRIELDRNQGFTAKELYSNHIPFDPFQDATVVVEDCLHTFRIGGMPMCVDLITGKPIWGPVRTEGQGKAALAYADDRLYTLHSDGRMALIVPSRTGYVEKGNFRIPGHQPSSGATFPVVTGGRLYVRNDDRLFCYSVARGATKPETIQVRLTPPAKSDNAQAADAKERTLRSVFVPTPHDVVEKMLALAKVAEDDVVYDLGSGDGRIVITAAKEYGCRAVGYELDRQLVESSREQAKKDGVEKLATFEAKDLFTADLADASVVALYLLPRQLEKLVPQLQKMKSGSRIVSHHFAIPGVEPEETITVESSEDGEKHTLYRWRTPLKVLPGQP